jgi:hypothetical protein
MVVNLIRLPIKVATVAKKETATAVAVAAATLAKVEVMVPPE